ncbi:hypothetical protein V8C40DRAFT_257528 [Trichoderma camerunense]
MLKMLSASMLQMALVVQVLAFFEAWQSTSGQFIRQLLCLFSPFIHKTAGSSGFCMRAPLASGAVKPHTCVHSPRQRTRLSNRHALPAEPTRRPFTFTRRYRLIERTARSSQY